MATASSITDGLTADLTCSLCLSMFEVPKLLPNCPHTFCLACLQQMKLEKIDDPAGSTSVAAIRCPECRSLSIIGKGGFSGFLTNVIVQNIVSKIREHQKAVDKRKRNTCPHHDSPTEKYEMCPHCGKTFCPPCTLDHIEMLKVEMTNLFYPLREKLRTFSRQAILEKVDAFLEKELTAVESSVTTVSKITTEAFEASVREKASHIIRRARKFADAERQRLNDLTMLLGDNKEMTRLHEQLSRISSSSDLQRELQVTAQCYLDISDQCNMVKTIDLLASKGSSLICAEAKSSRLARLVEIFEEIELYSLKLTQSAIDLGCTLPETNQFCQHSPDQSISRIDVFSKSRTDRLIGVSNPRASFSSNDFILFPFSIAAERRYKNPKRIIAIPSKRYFAISHGDCNIDLLSPNGEVKKSFNVIMPEFDMLQVDDIASDNRSTIFFTATVRDKTSRVTSRRIYRLWINESVPSEPKLFVVAVCNASFQGLAISPKWRWLLTTEGRDIVAFASIDLHKNELGMLAFRLDLGPTPYMLSVVDSTANCEQLTVTCSTDEQLCRVTISSRAFTVVELKTLLSSDPQTSLAIRRPNRFCCWGDKAIIAKSRLLFKFDQFSGNNPKISGVIPSNFSLKSLCGKDLNGLAAFSCETPSFSSVINQEFLAVIYHTGNLIISSLTESDEAQLTSRTLSSLQ